MSSEGGAIRYDEGKLEWNMLPLLAIKEVIKVYMYGKKKYPDGEIPNWYKGMKFSRCYNSGTRHRITFWEGENLDKESGKYHLAHSIWNDLTILTYMLENRKGLDDRLSVLIENAKELENKSN